MNNIINTILSNLHSVSFLELEILVSTQDGVPLDHNFASEDSVDDLAAVSSAMWALGKKITHQGNPKYSFVEVDTKDFLYVIGDMFEGMFCLLKVPHATNVDRALLITESRAALKKTCIAVAV